jgi:hypothetical protein
VEKGTQHKTKEKGTQHVFWVIHQIVIPVSFLQIIYLINEQWRKDHIKILLCLFIKSLTLVSMGIIPT